MSEPKTFDEARRMRVTALEDDLAQSKARHRMCQDSLAAVCVERNKLRALLGECLGVMERGHDQLWGIDAPTVAARIREELGE